MGSSLSRFEPAILSAVAVLGLTCWFFLGFPFANHNESYALVAQLKVMTLTEVLSHPLFPVANYRPLGQGAAWLLFHWSGGSLIPVQLFNYSVGAAAWILLLFALKERRTFSLASLVVGGVYFSGYIYLFHLHGVFYSPLLLLIAALFHLYDRSPRSIIVVTAFVITALTSLFHPYALLIYAAATGGMLLERWRNMNGKERTLPIVFLAASLGLFQMLVLSPGKQSLLNPAEMLVGLVASYRMTEVNLALSAISLALSVMTALSFPLAPNRTIPLVLGAVVGGALLYLAGVPLLFLWIVLCGMKMVILRKWWIAFLIGITALFPAPAATGSPTYELFVLMLCAASLPYGWRYAEERLSSIGGVPGLTGVCVAVVVTALVRFNVYVPLVAEYAAPLVAEREKTEQLENIIRWVRNSPYREYDLTLEHNALNPSLADDAINRTHRPPTDQEYLSLYMNSLRGPREVERLPGKQLLIAFGQLDTTAGGFIHVEHKDAAGYATVSLVAD